MRLPAGVRGTTARFVCFMVLDAVLSLLIGFGPPVGLFYFLAPTSFSERVVAALLCGSLFGVMGLCAFMFFAWFGTETTGL